jgi:hypothetical protein
VIDVGAADPHAELQIGHRSCSSSQVVRGWRETAWTYPRRDSRPVEHDILVLSADPILHHSGAASTKRSATMA